MLPDHDDAPSSETHRIPRGDGVTYDRVAHKHYVKLPPARQCVFRWVHA